MHAQWNTPIEATHTDMSQCDSGPTTENDQIESYQSSFAVVAACLEAPKCVKASKLPVIIEMHESKEHMTLFLSLPCMRPRGGEV